MIKHTQQLTNLQIKKLAAKAKRLCDKYGNAHLIPDEKLAVKHEGRVIHMLPARYSNVLLTTIFLGRGPRHAGMPSRHDNYWQADNKAESRNYRSVAHRRTLKRALAKAFVRSMLDLAREGREVTEQEINDGLASIRRNA